MSFPVDFDALQVDTGPSVSILNTTTVTSAGTGDVYTGFAALDRLIVEIDVSRLIGKREPSLTVTVEQSNNGDIWETVTTNTFTKDGKHQLAVDAPKDQWRVSWTIAGGVRQCVIRSVSIVPGIFDEPGGSGTPTIEQILTVSSNANGQNIEYLDNVGTNYLWADVIGGWNGNTVTINGLVDPVNEQDPATRKYTDDLVESLLTTPLAADLDMNNHNIHNVSDPAFNNDAVSQIWVQNAFQSSGEKGVPNGYAPLDGDGLVPTANLPGGAVTNVAILTPTLIAAAAHSALETHSITAPFGKPDWCTIEEDNKTITLPVGTYEVVYTVRVTAQNFYLTSVLATIEWEGSNVPAAFSNFIGTISMSSNLSWSFTDHVFIGEGESFTLTIQVYLTDTEDNWNNSPGPRGLVIKRLAPFI